MRHALLIVRRIERVKRHGKNPVTSGYALRVFGHRNRRGNSRTLLLCSLLIHKRMCRENNDTVWGCMPLFSMVLVLRSALLQILRATHPLWRSKRCQRSTDNSMRAIYGWYICRMKRRGRIGKRIVQKTSKVPLVSIELWLKVLAPDGLVFYSGHENANTGSDFVALYLKDWMLYYLFQLGSGITNIR